MILSVLLLAVVQFESSAPLVSTLPVMRAPQTQDGRAALSIVRFRELPNVQVTYYDVAGHDIPEIHRSLAKTASRDPLTHEPIPATSSWSVKAALKSLTSGGRCTITGVRLDFHASANMPRLLIDRDTPPAVVTTWNDYAARLEASQAAQLRFAHDRLGEVERAVTGVPCDKANAAADAALARIKAGQLEAKERDKKDSPRLEQPTD